MFSNTSILQKSAFMIAGMFLLITLVAPASVFAVTNGGTDSSKKSGTGTIPTKFNSQVDCTTKMKAYDLAKIKEYGKKRFDNRKKELSSLEKQVNNYDKSGAIKAVTAARKKYKTPTNVDIQPISHKAGLLAEIQVRQSSISTANTGLGEAKDAAKAAEAVCKGIYATRVYTYMKLKVQNQKKVDNLYNKNQVNRIIHESIKDKSKLPDVMNTNENITTIHNALNKVTMDGLDAESAKEAKAIFAQAMTGYKSVDTKVKNEAKVLKAAYKVENKTSKGSKKAQGKNVAADAKTQKRIDDIVAKICKNGGPEGNPTPNNIADCKKNYNASCSTGPKCEKVWKDYKVRYKIAD